MTVCRPKSLESVREDFTKLRRHLPCALGTDTFVPIEDLMATDGVAAVDGLGPLGALVPKSFYHRLAVPHDGLPMMNLATGSSGDEWQAAIKMRELDPTLCYRLPEFRSSGDPALVLFPQELGRGNFGSVYLGFVGREPSADQPFKLLRTVAVKVPLMKPASHVTALSEEAVLAFLWAHDRYRQSPYLLQILGVAVKEYLVMLTPPEAEPAPAPADGSAAAAPAGRASVAMLDMQPGAAPGIGISACVDEFAISNGLEPARGDARCLVFALSMYGDLDHYKDRQRGELRAQPWQYLKFMLDMARGVQLLHSLDLVHCDIALRNFLVSSEKVVMLSDFGLARHHALPLRPDSGPFPLVRAVPRHAGGRD